LASNIRVYFLHFRPGLGECLIFFAETLLTEFKIIVRNVPFFFPPSANVVYFTSLEVFFLCSTSVRTLASEKADGFAAVSQVFTLLSLFLFLFPFSSR